MKLAQFSYFLPKQLIAQEPLCQRDESRLLVINRKTQSLKQTIFKEIVNLIQPGDLLVLNNTRVLPARLMAKRKTGGQLEVLLLKEKSPGLWETLVKPGKKARLGEDIFFAGGRYRAKIQERTIVGGRLLRFQPAKIKSLLRECGRMPLPGYIKKELAAPQRYQTVYAKKEGAVAAPTAGFHFTRALLKQLVARGVKIVYLTLHCGLATFRPVKTGDIREHQMEPEVFEINAQAAAMINQAKAQSRRIIAVGTTVARAIEAASLKHEQGIYQVKPQQAQTNLYIYPGYKFKMIDAILTNFHLPHSTNLIMVCAFAGIDLVLSAYAYAIKKRFRFYSFGDATLII